MTPGKHPQYRLSYNPFDGLPFSLDIVLPIGVESFGESAVTLAASASTDFLDGIRKDLENSPLGFEEMSEKWGLRPDLRQLILDNLDNPARRKFTKLMVVQTENENEPATDEQMLFLRRNAFFLDLLNLDFQDDQDALQVAHDFNCGFFDDTDLVSGDISDEDINMLASVVFKTTQE